MSGELRCPNCGGLVSADAEWCGQCYARLDRPGGDTAQPPQALQAPASAQAPAQQVPSDAPADPAVGGPSDTPAGPAAGGPSHGTGPVRRTDQGLVWTCPRCEQVSPIESRICSRCGTRFESLFALGEEAPRVDPARATRLSLLFPGAGHVAAGRVGDGVARAIVFAWTALSALAIAVMGGGLRAGPILVLYLGAAGLVYAVSAVDARRAATGQPPVLNSRVLLYGVTGLILLTVAILFLSGIRVR